MSAAGLDEPVQVTSVTHVNFGENIFVCAHNPDVIETEKFANVRITIPASKNFKSYKDFIGVVFTDERLTKSDFSDLST